MTEQNIKLKDQGSIRVLLRNNPTIIPLGSRAWNSDYQIELCYTALYSSYMYICIYVYIYIYMLYILYKLYVYIFNGNIYIR